MIPRASRYGMFWGNPHPYVDLQGNRLFEFRFGDYDTRRMLVPFGKAPADQLDEDNEEEVSERICKAMQQYTSRMTPSTWKLKLDASWNVVESGDESPEMYGKPLPCFYPALEDCAWLANLGTVSRTQMVEVDRNIAVVDTCFYATRQLPKKWVIFKYHFVWSEFRRIWNELQIWSSIPPHPHIAPFDRLVVDEGRILGFTVDYIPGGDLVKHPPRTIKLMWLKQLIAAVDDLNLKYGVWHRDIHPRNILIDASKDSIQVVDFNVAVRFGEDGAWSEDSTRADPVGVAFTFYELITRDYHYRDSVWDYPTVSEILNDQKWDVHRDVTLDHEPHVFQRELSSWLATRLARGYIQHYHDCPDHIGPARALPEAPYVERESLTFDGQKTTSWVPIASTEEFEKTGTPIIQWLRPVQDEIKEGATYLANGSPLVNDLQIVE